MSTVTDTVGNGGSEGISPLLADRIKFSCHPGIACFTACCADLNLILTPYDILRMKNRLGLTAGDFIAQYTEQRNEGGPFPMLHLRMKEDAGRRCPFVSAAGCGIYEDRPGACRLYPLGRAAKAGVSGQNEREAYFVVKEAHCLGFAEERESSVEEWTREQGLQAYHEMNRGWMEIVTRPNPKDLTAKKLEMFYLASYNLDRFREFVFQTKFLSVFEIPPVEADRLANDDVLLMNLAMKWLKFVLFGEDTLTPRVG